ncbi:uncharacterized protein C630.12 [Lingula anatina]|uniref:Uncharacterized protein C630.12 n=1 Tax=Lingula anatina TaxID=7574 RepID=A0A1S3H1V4_LINAN|nr:uncharacterized protein C630.12 [Lingula anatina]XP_013379115.1 uncharacterized protein C630.12 [Lingula anatina]XP_013379117.1 uncharacterized protein C630.12 [Lingula anatina]XP_013379118.1 uncharacterized protein C630.12 [Lingula anatina]XP_013379119.1 uncharacterized protein C630.12 [Lingula anatina]XP_013379120.1 uncharacterized protein C630.12 [Lingula anatina]XP_013379121.1 uncharacterized protein C630.12 [Lingula anatina]|eukprot:XP_013379114.1 uncharacterized protein C630.12 [Lingula anatina]
MVSWLYHCKRRVRSHPLELGTALIVILTVFINEYGLYYAQYKRWIDLESARFWFPEKQTLFLLVADPQLLGYRRENIITRWDCDRYLKKTFDLAYDYVKPDAILFLGDLFDEGNEPETTTDEYRRTFQRFMDIFQKEKVTGYGKTAKVEMIPVAGDNDIGGEFDAKLPWKIERFEEFFGKTSDVHRIKFVQVVKPAYYSRDTLSGEKAKEFKKLLGQLDPSDHVLTVVANHQNVISSNTQSVISLLKPDLILSGDTHKLKLYICDNCQKIPSNNWRSQDIDHFTDFVTLDLKEDILYEIVVPSCSYRMGVPDMGYGVLVLERPGKAFYTTLWLPSRLIQLKGYLVIINVLLVFWTLVCICRCLRRC